MGPWPWELVDRCVIAVHRAVPQRHGDVVRPIVQSWDVPMPGVVIDLAEFILADALTDEVVRWRYPFLPPDVVTASLARRPVDDVLEPQLRSVLAARSATADELWQHVGEQLAVVLAGASAALDAARRPLACALRALSPPATDAARTHHVLTGLRYERLGAHAAACADAGLTWADAVALTLAWSGAPLDDRPQTLVDRGLVAADGAITRQGRSLRDRIEARTDAACEPMARAIDDLASWTDAMTLLAGD